ncbi:virion structural protein [Pseudomonas phage Phabio]|uniref:Virion structural protein n=1 Tax=Pseudomonas phage Phabio TaxID=2006668 RepID=A0A1Y0STX8_9CAUD|nr:virion structural protein [Pseudomonas phage Phabio]ARV76770.1 virion structural protein [Pseudomonas phage Phabio]
MDIKRLQQFITLSNEDFADAHEPVNDGVKEVPDADDIAKMVTRSGGSGESDLTTQGEGKVIPEKPDTDEVVEKKEETTTTETTEETETPAKAPPFEKKEETSETTTDLEEETEKKDPTDEADEEIKKASETVETLQHSRVAVEQYIELLRGNKRISKQAAAVIQVGLEHIDTTCELKVRAFGLESFDTTPKSAMESADVNENSLLSRAGEIGAKILRWLEKIIEHLEVFFQKYRAGLTETQKNVEGVIELIKPLDSLRAVELRNVSKYLYIGDEFVGDQLTRDEKLVPDIIKTNRAYISSRLFGPLMAIINGNQANEDTLEDLKQLRLNIYKEGGNKVLLPGGAALEVDGGIKIDYNELHDQGYEHTKTSGAKRLDVPEMPSGEAIRNLQEILKYLDQLDDTGTAQRMVNEGYKIKEAVIKLRKRSKDVDEVLFQNIQREIEYFVMGAFSPVGYYRVLGDLGKAQEARVRYYRDRATQLKSSN